MSKPTDRATLTHIQRLEAEAIHIMREVVAEAERPVMLYSVGKDSAVMLHLARKAFFPSPPPFPLLHVDTTWKFQAMYEMRARMAEESGMELLIHQNPEAAEKGINPFDHGPLHTDMWKTEGLKQALDSSDVEIGDVNGDGWNDVVATQYDLSNDTSASAKRGCTRGQKSIRGLPVS